MNQRYQGLIDGYNCKQADFLEDVGKELHESDILRTGVGAGGGALLGYLGSKLFNKKKKTPKWLMPLLGGLAGGTGGYFSKPLFDPGEPDEPIIKEPEREIEMPVAENNDAEFQKAYKSITSDISGFRGRFPDLIYAPDGSIKMKSDTLIGKMSIHEAGNYLKDKVDMALQTYGIDLLDKETRDSIRSRASEAGKMDPDNKISTFGNILRDIQNLFYAKKSK